MFLSSGDVYVRKHLVLPEGCQKLFLRFKREDDFSLETLQQKRPHLALTGRISCVFLCAAAANMGFLSSNNGGPQDSTVSGKSSLHASCQTLRIPLHSFSSHRGPHMELRVEPQDSFPVPTWIWGSSGVSIEVRPRLVETCMSALSRDGNSVSGFLLG